MKFSYQILPEKRLNLLYFRGSVSVRDIARAARQFWSDTHYNPTFNGIACLEGVTTRAKVEELRELLELLERRRCSVANWTAILTEPRPTALALIFKAAFAGTFKLEIVSSWAAACEQLQVELPPEYTRASRSRHRLREDPWSGASLDPG